MFQKRANERISYHQTRRDAREGGMPKQEQEEMARVTTEQGR